MIEAEGISKRYGTVTALDGLDLEAAEGTVVGLLGPNGAGKTTTVGVLSTLVEPDAGTMRIAAIDARRDPAAVRAVIGLCSQDAALDEHLTGLENLTVLGRMHRLGRRGARTRAGELLEVFELSEAADRPVRSYSGGMRRRLDLAAALVSQPRVLFLDEPTSGLDPPSRMSLWTLLQELVADGCTVLLTTQNMDEADRLADHIVLINNGQVAMRGSPDELKERVGAERIRLAVESADQLVVARRALGAIAVGEIVVDEPGRTLTAPVPDGAGSVLQVLRRLDALGVVPTHVGQRTPTLEDVFMAVARDAPTAPPHTWQPPPHTNAADGKTNG